MLLRIYRRSHGNPRGRSITPGPVGFGVLFLRVHNCRQDISFPIQTPGSKCSRAERKTSKNFLWAPKNGASASHMLGDRLTVLIRILSLVSSRQIQGLINTARCRSPPSPPYPTPLHSLSTFFVSCRPLTLPQTPPHNPPWTERTPSRKRTSSLPPPPSSLEP